MMRDILPKRLYLKLFKYVAYPPYHQKNISALFIVIAILVLPSGLSPALAQQVSNFIHLDQEVPGTSYIESDRFGNMLVVSSTAINKYNGYSFERIPFRKLFGSEYSSGGRVIFNKDQQGSFWLATFNGKLIRFDANEKKLPLPSEPPNKAGSERTSAITSGQAATWFGSSNGTLHRFNYADSVFEKIVTLPLVAEAPQVINSLALTAPDQIWIGTADGKVYGYNSSRDKLEELTLSFTNDLPVYIRLVADHTGRLWISTELTGLYVYEPHLRSLTEVPTYNSTLTLNRYPMFYSLFCDKQGNIWAGTDGDGLYKIDAHGQVEAIFRNNDRNSLSLSNNTVIDINEDCHGNLWVITKNGEIDVLPNYNNTIEYHAGTAGGSPASVLCLFKSSEGSIWIGTDGKGLNRIFANGESVQYGNGLSPSYNFPGRYIQRLVESASGKLWIATYQSGLYTYDLKQDIFTKVVVSDISEHANSDFRFLFKDDKERIWASTIAGVHVFAEDTRLLATFSYRTHGLSGTISESIHQTDEGSLWVGTDQGLYRLVENSDKLSQSYFEKIVYSEETKEHQGNNNPLYMTSDNKKNLWITTATGALTRLNPSDLTFTSYADHPTLKGISVSAVLFDKSDNMWLSSGRGIHRYDAKSDSLQSYFRVDGLQGDSFVRKSAFSTENGRLYFGGVEGVNGFYPDSMTTRVPESNLYTQEIEILNQSADKIIPEQLQDGLANVKNLQLRSDQSSFSFHFSAIGNLLNPNYYYSYRLTGFDDDWVYPESQRVATYTNIPSGHYNFEVRAGTKRGVWDIPYRQIAIFIAPPWWQSSFAYFSYGMAILLIISGITLWVRMKNRMSREELLFSKEKELYALKMNFFAKMSHEIQTPLTLIMAPIDEMVRSATANNNLLLKQRLTLIKNNAQRLSRISAELMTIRNKEMNTLKIFPEKRNIVTDIKKIADSFAEHARFKNIVFTEEYDYQEVLLWYDVEKLEHVFYNLLSNAFKFTPRGGAVHLYITDQPDKQCVTISVTDSGPGIPAEEREDIFELFYQSEVGKKAKGQGIGLAFSKELIDLHHGSIKVSSSEQGTSFVVLLKKGNIFSAGKEVPLPIPQTNTSQPLAEVSFLADESNEITQETTKKRGTILIVEDNVEMQIFLQGLFSSQFYVLIAENGEEGIEFARKKSPDVIVSDIMMPVMDGISMSKKLLKAKATAHIPILLLTAKNTAEAKLSGFASGALAYIQKPFAPHELLLRVSNILDNKDKTITKHRADVLSAPRTENVSSKDEQFLERLASELNKELENAEFRLEDLADSMNMSYSGIYRRCQQVVGKTPLEYFKIMRLQHAVILIVENSYNISEAAYMVGYKDSKYFTKCFKSEFGIAPMAMKREHQKIGMAALAKKYRIPQLQVQDSTIPSESATY
ncbi:two-component regulator propeller domain-containing protein [Tunicatimonas pelagia]|uniref:two-component regulator propeller domain-containing protein n=1 Tax=Tunicatimonas pelagia TaxID=931531 RepID=UPI002666389A|nr:two-component regulator propeller domain-containing protein [Tunicatimonas pelagia]WKN44188.1 two-component regulator propeller domain-containing protein [Tunicatimonas pelagia]